MSTRTTELYCQYPDDITKNEYATVVTRGSVMKFLPGIPDKLVSNKGVSVCLNEFDSAFFDLPYAGVIPDDIKFKHDYLELVVGCVIRDKRGKYLAHTESPRCCRKELVGIPDLYNLLICGHVKFEMSDSSLRELVYRSMRVTLAEDYYMLFTEERKKELYGDVCDYMLAYTNKNPCEQNKLLVLKVFDVTEEEIENSLLGDSEAVEWYTAEELQSHLRLNDIKFNPWSKTIIEKL